MSTSQSKIALPFIVAKQISPTIAGFVSFAYQATLTANTILQIFARRSR